MTHSGALFSRQVSNKPKGFACRACNKKGPRSLRNRRGFHQYTACMHFPLWRAHHSFQLLGGELSVGAQLLQGPLPLRPRALSIVAPVTSKNEASNLQRGPLASLSARVKRPPNACHFTRETRSKVANSQKLCLYGPKFKFRFGVPKLIRFTLCLKICSKILFWLIITTI